MRKAVILSALLAFAISWIAPMNLGAPPTQPGSKVKIKDKIPSQAYPFELGDVRLLDGPFREAMLRDQKYMLELDPDRLLHSFRVTAGLPSTAQPLGGWEEPKGELRGHSVGHFLTACGLMYAGTGDARFKEKGDAVVAELAQAALETEYGGMNEVLANLYAVTGNPDYLTTAFKFNHQKLFDQWAAGEDKLDGLHGNTQFPRSSALSTNTNSPGKNGTWTSPAFSGIGSLFIAHSSSAATQTARSSSPSTSSPKTSAPRAPRPATPITCSS